MGWSNIHAGPIYTCFAFVPTGTEYRYSTHAWTLASAVVEGASGKDFKLLMRNLLKDLGMNNTYIEEAKIIVYNRAR